MEAKLLAQRIQTPDGTILHSKHRHDYVTHTDANGETYMVDGGFEYRRGSVNKVPAKDLCVYTDDDHQKIREAFCWGTRGKDGRQPVEYKPLQTLSTEHVEAIIETQHHIPEHIRKVFLDEIEYRNGMDENTKKWYMENPDRG
jgi:hypothetical protein